MPLADLISPKILQAVLENVPAAIVVTGPANRDTPILYANTEFSRITGYSLEQIRGRNPRMLQPEALPREQRLKRHQVANSILKGKNAACRLLNKRSDGTTYWAEFRASPIKNAEGRIVAWVAAQVDVSRQVDAENKLAEQLASFIDTEIELLVQLLWKRSPHAAWITERQLRLARAVGPHWHRIDEVELCRAAQLALVGFLILDDDVLTTLDEEGALSDDQLDTLHEYPLRSAEIAMSLPNIEHVVEAIQRHWIYRAELPSDEDRNTSTLSVLGQALTMLMVLDTNVRRRYSLVDAFDQMKKQCGDFDGSLIAEFQNLLPVLAESGWPERWEKKVVPVSEIRVDSLANQDIVDTGGRVLLKSGQLLTESLVERLKRMVKKGLIGPTISVTVKR